MCQQCLRGCRTDTGGERGGGCDDGSGDRGSLCLLETVRGWLCHEALRLCV
ncbi:hypothetical protein LI99_27190 [Mycolicibacterium smegmatis]|uniref:Uncharacterized protein n=1 Tax=Mycolicibacterium smegmatis (strain ATCC 700084 / mc(2)155) TaxID=246196 RepID=A0R3K0_MYCS2|nr:hypothetical protein MSMEG_5500 [Mycolicibacterium smegmatis MC2 155]AIU17143.1 hypothetical protein LI99_27190 [Mycolicibacterium smegmatis]AIU10518.1 hypothetical protein LJ00_27185 [Mycolicibacterium smegmatis MC2 155]AIU23766.1 hypothetical protein LI98_27195 [Mycolicibacterium smegmatis]TBH49069.1 hypothetical protein EYS45_06560 [Mycolicibacterium smegmatis MC2 155]